MYYGFIWVNVKVYVVYMFVGVVIEFQELREILSLEVIKDQNFSFVVIRR